MNIIYFNLSVDSVLHVLVVRELKILKSFESEIVLIFAEFPRRLTLILFLKTKMTG